MTRPFDPERYVRVLASDGRDRRGALVYAGASVVAHPDEPSVFAIDSPETRAEFAERGFAWTPERRARNYFPVPTRESLAPFELARVASANFFAALEINLRRAVGTEAPFATRRFLRKTKIAGVRRENDLSSELRELLWRAVGNPSDLEPSDEWRAPVEDASRAELFRLTGKSPALVLALFLAPVAVAPDEPPKLVPPSVAVVEAAKRVRDDFVARADFRKPPKLFVALGALDRPDFGGAPLDWKAALGPDAIVVASVWRRNRDSRDRFDWDVELDHAALVGSEATRAFVSRLRPESDYKLAQIVRETIEGRSDITLYLEFIARWAGASLDEVKRGVGVLVESGERELRSKDGKLAICERKRRAR